MTVQELRRLARLGAESRLQAIRREEALIYGAFPDLRPGRSEANPYSAGVRAAVAGVRGAVQGAVRRRRPKMSAEGRARIVEAQRKRWAAWKAQRSAAKDTSRKSPAARATAAGGARKKK